MCLWTMSWENFFLILYALFSLCKTYVLVLFKNVVANFDLELLQFSYDSVLLYKLFVSVNKK